MCFLGILLKDVKFKVSVFLKYFVKGLCGDWVLFCLVCFVSLEWLLLGLYVFLFYLVCFNYELVCIVLL